MKKTDPLVSLQEELDQLILKEKQLQQEMKTLADSIKQNATPSGIAKGMAAKVFNTKGGLASTATAALGLGATLVAGNIARKQQRLSLMGKALGLASGFIISRIAKRRQNKSA